MAIDTGGRFSQVPDLRDTNPQYEYGSDLLFDAFSTDVWSPVFRVSDTKAVLITLFANGATPAGIEVYRVGVGRSLMPSGEACGCGDITQVNPTNIMHRARCTLGGHVWAANEANPHILIQLPGFYQLKLDNAEDVGVVFVSSEPISRLPSIPRDYAAGVEGVQ